MPYTHNERTAVLLYEVGHVALLQRFLEEEQAIASEGVHIFALDREVETALGAAGIPFTSGESYRSRDPDYMVLAEKFIDALLKDTRWSFFRYRSVPLLELYFLSLQSYIGRPLYYTDILSTILARHPACERLVVFPALTPKPRSGSVLVGLQIDSVVDTVMCIAKATGRQAVVPVADITAPPTRRNLFVLKRALSDIVLGMMNAVVATMRPARRTRILVSDYWKNVAPYARELKDAELLFVDRKEVLNAGFGAIWKFRMRFARSASYAGHPHPDRAETQALFENEWRSLRREGALPLFEFRGVSLRPLVVEALDRVLSEVLHRTLASIDDTYSMLAEIRPTAVILRSTISTQPHFIVLAKVARAMGIPSIEMQHGLEYYGPAAVHTRHRAEFTGVYGPLVSQQMKEAHDTDTTPVVLGSPRFDVYASLLRGQHEPPRSSDTLTILCIAPSVDTGWDTDTYDTEEYYAAVAASVREVPDAEVIIKLRPGPNRDAFVRPMLASVFAGISHAIAQYEPLVELYPKADIVISCFSTALLEALQCAKPVVYLGLSPTHAMMGLHDFSVYAKEGVIRLATTREELTAALEELRDPAARARLSARATEFLAHAYAFDGGASERSARFIESFEVRR